MVSLVSQSGAPAEEEGLSRWSLLCFAVGHVLNDMYVMACTLVSWQKLDCCLTARLPVLCRSLAVWLTFTLVFLKSVVGLRPSMAGIVMLAGQG